MAEDILTLKKARLLYHRGEYATVIRSLEKNIFHFYDDIDYFLVLGASYLRTGDLNGAHAFFTRVVKADPRHVEANLALALIATLRGDATAAIKCCLAVLDQDPQERRAKTLLEALRRFHRKEELVSWLHRQRLIRLGPQIPGKPFPWRAVFLVAGGIFFVSTLVQAGPRVWERLTGQRRPDQIRPGILNRGIEGVRDLLKYEGAFEEILLASEVESLFRKAQELMLQYRDNEARVLLNRLLRSNASDAVKAQVLALIEHQSRPDFTTTFHSYSPREIQIHPTRYEGVYVRWKGAVANLQVSEAEITFDFLVGYHEGKVLEAVVPVRLRFAVFLENGDPVDLLGQVVLEGDRWLVEGQSLHRMGVRRSP